MSEEREKGAGERGIHESISLLFSSRLYILTLHDQVISDGEPEKTVMRVKRDRKRYGNEVGPSRLFVSAAGIISYFHFLCLFAFP